MLSIWLNQTSTTSPLKLPRIYLIMPVSLCIQRFCGFILFWTEMSDAHEITWKLAGRGALWHRWTHHHRMFSVCVPHSRSRNRCAITTDRESNRSSPGQPKRRVAQASPQIRQSSTCWNVSGCKWLYTNACSDVFSEYGPHSHSDSRP